MGSIQNTVYYCCVSKGSRIIYSYGNGDHEIENLAALCLERTPPYHMWYFQTMGRKTFGFLMEDGFVYFAIVDDGLGNPGILRFLGHVRDEFKKVAKRGSSRSMSNLSSLGLQDQLVPVIHHLINSLEWPIEMPSPHNNGNAQIEGASSTKAPLLGKSGKQEKKKMKDHAIGMRDFELEEHRRSMDRGVRVDSGNLDSNNQGTSASSISLQKDMGSMRMRSSTQTIRKKWCRQVRIVLAIDAAVCLLLFVIWLVVCGGTECIH